MRLSRSTGGDGVSPITLGKVFFTAVQQLAKKTSPRLSARVCPRAAEVGNCFDYTAEGRAVQATLGTRNPG